MADKRSSREKKPEEGRSFTEMEFRLEQGLAVMQALMRERKTFIVMPDDDGGWTVQQLRPEQVHRGEMQG